MTGFWVTASVDQNLSEQFIVNKIQGKTKDCETYLTKSFAEKVVCINRDYYNIIINKHATEYMKQYYEILKIMQ